MADTPFTVEHVEEVIDGQPQSAHREPHDGKTPVRETRVTTDEFVLDPNSDKAVQVPEGVGATSTDQPLVLAEQYKRGTADEQFAAASKPKQASRKSE